MKIARIENKLVLSATFVELCNLYEKGLVVFMGGNGLYLAKEAKNSYQDYMVACPLWFKQPHPIFWFLFFDSQRETEDAVEFSYEYYETAKNHSSLSFLNPIYPEGYVGTIDN